VCGESGNEGGLWRFRRWVSGVFLPTQDAVAEEGQTPAVLRTGFRSDTSPLAGLAYANKLFAYANIFVLCDLGRHQLLSRCGLAGMCDLDIISV
jgi:hypothetical protein